MQRLTTTFVLATFFLTACSSTASPQPTYTVLPTAIQPETLPGTWAVPFGTGFRAGFWSVGIHRYSITVDCPSSTQDIEGVWNSFEVTEETAIDPNPIFLRLSGLSAGPLFPLGIRTINPAQETVAYVTLLGLDENGVQDAINECQIFMFFDDQDTPFQLLPLEPYQA